MQGIASGEPRRWLLVSNCTTPGLANCLNLLSGGIEVEGVDIGAFRRRFDEFRPRLDSYELFIAPPRLVRNELVDFSEVGPVQPLPTIYFDAYHPDLCYLETADGTLLQGVLGDYNSKIITVAYQAGMSRRDARALFNGRRFRDFGYLDRWQQSRERLLSDFSAVGLDLATRFPHWGTHGAFMHSVNHPSVRVLHDIASALLANLDVPTAADNRLLPHDNLLNGPVWPVYGEIADSLSVPGSYWFKLAGAWRCIGLEAFIAESYRLLESAGAGVRCRPVQRASFEQVRSRL